MENITLQPKTIFPNTLCALKGKRSQSAVINMKKSMATSIPNSDVLVFYVSYLEPSSRIYFFLASTATEKAHKVNIYRFQL